MGDSSYKADGMKRIGAELRPCGGEIYRGSGAV